MQCRCDTIATHVLPAAPPPAFKQATHVYHKYTTSHGFVLKKAPPHKYI